jgi:hypothetical protein
VVPAGSTVSHSVLLPRTGNFDCLAQFHKMRHNS